MQAEAAAPRRDRIVVSQPATRVGPRIDTRPCVARQHERCQDRLSEDQGPGTKAGPRTSRTKNQAGPRTKAQGPRTRLRAFQQSLQTLSLPGELVSIRCCQHPRRRGVGHGREHEIVEGAKVCQERRVVRIFAEQPAHLVDESPRRLIRSWRPVRLRDLGDRHEVARVAAVRGERSGALEVRARLSERGVLACVPRPASVPRPRSSATNPRS